MTIDNVSTTGMVGILVSLFDFRSLRGSVCLVVKFESGGHIDARERAQSKERNSQEVAHGIALHRLILLGSTFCVDVQMVLDVLLRHDDGQPIRVAPTDQGDNLELANVSSASEALT